MQFSSGQEIRGFYKQLEDAINQQLYSYANSEAFVKIIRTAMDEHLNHVTAVRELATLWLTCMDAPSRQDVADVTRQVIAIENRIDNLEDTLYQTGENLHKLRQQMASLTAKLNLQYQ